MHAHTQRIPTYFAPIFAAVLAAASLLVNGCTATGAVNNITTPGANSASVPVSITDAPSDEVVAASLTINSIVLTDSSGAPTSILSAPVSFEATHLDAVQEPLFTPAIPEGTYASVTLTYSNAQVAYIDPTLKQVVLATATLANTSQTITFASPVTVSNTTTSLLLDYLVANSVSISGSTVTVTPAFHVMPAPISAQPTNGTNGLLSGVKGKVTALGTNSFTLTNAEGLSLVIAVNTNTQYQGLSGFSALAVGALVEVDIEVQPNASFMALRVEEQVPPNATAVLLVGPVTAVTGSPATSFTEMVRQKIGPTPTTTPVESDTITINSSTQFLLPGRYDNLVVGGSPFTPTFNASTLFAGQVVAVAAPGGVTNNAATAGSVTLAPQTVAGTINSILAPICLGCWNTITLTLPSGSWLATITGKTTVTVLLPPGAQSIVAATPAVSTEVRFNGFLFNNNGTLTLIAAIEGPAPGTAISPVANPQ